MNIKKNVIFLYHPNLGFSAESAKFYAFAKYIGLCQGKLEKTSHISWHIWVGEKL